VPTPRTPPMIAVLENIEAEVQAQSALIVAQTAAIAALAEDLDRVANYQRYTAESTFGATPSSAGIWDGTDRYPEV